MTLTIPGLPDHMVHDRAEWERPSERIATWAYNGKVYVAPKADLFWVDANADHWPGTTSASIDSSTDAKVIAHLQASQHSYIVSRGYSYGYNFVIDQRGHVWELRGFDFKCAANFAHNHHVLAVQHMLGATQEPTPEMIHSSRLVHKECARRAGRATTPWTGPSGWWISGHNDLRQYPPLAGQGTPTGCCGPAMYDLLYTEPVGYGGELHPNKLDDPEDSDMKFTSPARIFDTRTANVKVNAESTTTITVPGGKGSGAAQVTITVGEPEGPGFLTAWSAGPQPPTSFQNYQYGQFWTPETMWVQLDANGAFKIYSLAKTHLFVDFTGILA